MWLIELRPSPESASFVRNLLASLVLHAAIFVAPQ